MHLGFLGLGNMGAPMARNLMKAGHQLTLYELYTASLDSLRAEGA